MKPVEVAVTVRRPADEVFALLAEVTNNPTWQGGMRSCTWTLPTTYDQVAHFLGRDVVSSFVVAHLEPGRRVRFRSTSGPFPIEETRTVEPVEAGSSRVTAVVAGDASGFFRVAAPLLRTLVARSVRGDYRRLVERLEAEPA